MKKNLKWYKLDYAACFYPVMTTRNTQSIFRLSAVMTDEVKPDLLFEALNEVLVRFPHFKVKLKAGFFWYYFEENTKPLKVYEEETFLKKFKSREMNDYLFRVCYFKRKISFEVFHGITDGLGAIEFFKALLYKYVLKLGYNPLSGNIINLDEEISSEELEDGFKRYAQKTHLKDIDIKKFLGGKPITVTGHHFKYESYGSISGEMSVSELKELAKKYDCNITHLIGAFIAKAIYESSKDKNKPVVLLVPANFRKLFPSKTLKNFILFVKIYIKPEDMISIELIIKEIKEQLKTTTQKEELFKQMNTTVNGEGLPIFQVMPLFLKYFFIRFGKLFYTSLHSIIFSNIGAVNFPLNCGVEKFMFNLNVSKTNPLNSALVSYGDKMVLTFTRRIVETEVERRFFSSLAKEDINIKVISNYREEEDVL